MTDETPYPYYWRVRIRQAAWGKRYRVELRRRRWFGILAPQTVGTSYTNTITGGELTDCRNIERTMGRLWERRTR